MATASVAPVILGGWRKSVGFVTWFIDIVPELVVSKSQYDLCNVDKITNKTNYFKLARTWSKFELENNTKFSFFHLNDWIYLNIKYKIFLTYYQVIRILVVDTALKFSNICQRGLGLVSVIRIILVIQTFMNLDCFLLKVKHDMNFIQAIIRLFSFDRSSNSTGIYMPVDKFTASCFRLGNQVERTSKCMNYKLLQSKIYKRFFLKIRHSKIMIVTGFSFKKKNLVS